MPIVNSTFDLIDVIFWKNYLQVINKKDKYSCSNYGRWFWYKAKAINKCDT
jgi:hypothetical protein